MLLGTAAALGCRRPKATGFLGYCFIADQAGRSVSVVDLTRFRVRKQIVLDAAPAQVIAHPTQPKVLVLAPEEGTVLEIDAVKLAVSRSAKAGSSALGMQLSPTNEAVWVLYRDPAELVQIPLDSLRPGKRIRLGAAPDNFDLGAGNVAAIGSASGRSVHLASLATGAIRRTLQMTDEPSLLRFRKDGRHLFVASRPERALGIFDVESGRTVVRLPLPVEPRNFAVKPDGGQLFISGSGMDAVVVVYVYETQIAETLLAGRAPAAMASLDTPAYLLAANPETNSITVLDLDNNGRFVASVQVGQQPGSILITPPAMGQDQYALVLNEASGDLAVIRIGSLVAQDAESRRRPTPVFTLIPVGEKPVSAAVLSFA
jgi:DNA-binding beta-propeller fold protein YncE